jgi:hypothetical protein
MRRMSGRPMKPDFMQPWVFLCVCVQQWQLINRRIAAAPDFSGKRLIF